MNVFSIGDGKKGGYELTRENYIEKTHKSFPFYQDVKRYKTPYFAICPACNNPIQIINLFGVQYQEEHTGRTSIHGRHYKNDVMGLASYSEKKYIDCPLHNPVAFRIEEVRANEQINDEIRAIVENNRRQICANMRQITGILINNKKLNEIIDDYIAARDYCYTHTNIFNIPYSILYTRNAINVYGRKVDDSGIGKRIQEAINRECKCFQVDNGQIQKQVDYYVELNLLVCQHRVRGNRQYMKVRLEEKINQNNYIVFEEEVEMKQYAY